MAGDWIPVEDVTPDKPEVMAMAATLGVTENEVLGGLVRFWIWCDAQSRDGHAIGVTERGLERITCVTGMFHAMTKVGWLVVDGEQVHVPNYEYHLSQNAKSRALAMKRQRRCRHARVTLLSRTERDKNVTTEENRREEKKRKPPTPFDPSAVAIPESLDCEAFRSAWSDWIAHREELRKKLTPTSVRQQLAQFADWGVIRAVEAIQYTIAKGWQGVREPDVNGKPKKRITQI